MGAAQRLHPGDENYPNDPNRWKWSWLDPLFWWAWDNGINPVVYVYLPNDTVAPGRSHEGYLWLCYLLCARYNLPWLEIWNEPNGPDPGSFLQPHMYKDRLGAGSWGARMAGKNPLIGGLSSKGNIDPVTYLWQLKYYGVTPDWYSGIALHPYGANRDEVISNVTYVTTSKPPGWLDFRELWVTEFGWNTEQNPRNWRWKTPQDQADAIMNTMHSLPSAGVKRSYIFTWRNFCNDADGNPPYCKAGIREGDNTPKPAYTALKNHNTP